jgi:ABC-type branched-subunit amino acid transport system substrate-binding protein
MKARRRAVLAHIAIGVLVAASCGSDRGDEESGGATGDTGGTTETTAAGEGGGAGDFGDLAGVCGPNAGGGEVPTGDPAETQGITADSITVGTVADPGFEGRPGLNQEMFDAGEAFVEWCNAAGGINGKQIELNFRDAAITEYQPVMQQSCQEDFAIVGSGAVQDNFWPTIGAACGLIDIAGFSVTPEKAGVSGRDPIEARSVQPVPNPSDQFQTGAYLIADATAPDAAARSGVLYGDLDTTIVQKDRVVAGLEEIGHEFVHEAGYNILGEANWAPFAAALQRDDVQFFHMVGEGGNFALLLQAMDEVGYRPEIMAMEANFYDQTWVDEAGPAADGIFVRTVFNPLEEADQNPATQQYIDLVEAVDGKVAQLGTQSMSAWLLFATAARDCDLDNDLTRTCVLEGASSVTDWTGGGLHVPTNPGANEIPECTVVLQVQDGAFTRFAPEEGFDCGEDSEEPFIVDIG